MKLIKLFFIILIVFADMAIGLRNEQQENSHDSYEGVLKDSDEQSSSSEIHEVERFFWKRKHTRRLTCKKFPRICRAKGSPGPNCCKKKCVDLKRDRHNCGKCGKKCKYNKICCNGKCVNPSFNKKHCGGCNNRCSNGGLCAFGLCSYA